VSVYPARATSREVAIPVGDAVLEGELVLPERAVGIVLFAPPRIR
jgi:hypothetical protein